MSHDGTRHPHDRPMARRLRRPGAAGRRRAGRDPGNGAPGAHRPVPGHGGRRLDAQRQLAVARRSGPVQLPRHRKHMVRRDHRRREHHRSEAEPLLERIVRTAPRKRERSIEFAGTGSLRKRACRRHPGVFRHNDIPASPQPDVQPVLRRHPGAARQPAPAQNTLSGRQSTHRRHSGFAGQSVPTGVFIFEVQPTHRRHPGVAGPAVPTVFAQPVREPVDRNSRSAERAVGIAMAQPGRESVQRSPPGVAGQPESVGEPAPLQQFFLRSHPRKLSEFSQPSDAVPRYQWGTGRRSPRRPR